MCDISESHSLNDLYPKMIHSFLTQALLQIVVMRPTEDIICFIKYIIRANFAFNTSQ